MIIISNNSVKGISFYLEKLDVNCGYYYNSNGKPMLYISDLFISKTNKKNIDVFILSKKNVGIDLEIVNEFPFSLIEIKIKFHILLSFYKMPDEEKLLTCKLWTILEAYAKFLGTKLIDLMKQENKIIFYDNLHGMINNIKFTIFKHKIYILTIVHERKIDKKQIKYENWNN